MPAACPFLHLRRANNLSTLLFRSTFFNRVPGVPLYVTDLNCHCIDPTQTAGAEPGGVEQPDRRPMGYCRSLLQRLPVSAAPLRVDELRPCLQLPGEHEADPPDELPEHLQPDPDGESDSHEPSGAHDVYRRQRRGLHKSGDSRHAHRRVRIHQLRRLICAGPARHARDAIPVLSRSLFSNKSVHVPSGKREVCRHLVPPGSGWVDSASGWTTQPPEYPHSPTASRTSRSGSAYRDGNPDFAGMYGQQSVVELARGRAGRIWSESEAQGGSRRRSSTTTRNKAIGVNPARPSGCGGARSQLCCISSPMSRVACVDASRWRPGGARNAAHGSSTTDCQVTRANCGAKYRRYRGAREGKSTTIS